MLEASPTLSAPMLLSELHCLFVLLLSILDLVDLLLHLMMCVSEFGTLLLLVDELPKE